MHAKEVSKASFLSKITQKLLIKKFIYEYTICLRLITICNYTSNKMYTLLKRSKNHYTITM